MRKGEDGIGDGSWGRKRERRGLIKQFELGEL